MNINIHLENRQGDREQVANVEAQEFPAVVLYKGRYWRDCGFCGNDLKGEDRLYMEFDVLVLPSDEDSPSLLRQAIDLLESAAMDFAKLKPFCGEIGPQMSAMYLEYLKTLREPATEKFCPTCAATRRFRVALHDMVRLQPKDDNIRAMYMALNAKLTSIIQTCPHHVEKTDNQPAPAEVPQTDSGSVYVDRVDMGNLLAGWSHVVHTSTVEAELKVGMLVKAAECEWDAGKPVPSGRAVVVEVLDILDRTSTGSKILWAVQMKRTPASYPRHQRPDHGGDTQTVLPTDWKLHMCAQASGREALMDWGPEDVMRVELQKQFDAGRDVWLISDTGLKILPIPEENENPAPAPPPNG